MTAVCRCSWRNQSLLNNELEDGHSIGANSRWHSNAFNTFLHFVTLTFGPNIKWVMTELMMDYLCGKFGICNFSRFSFMPSICFFALCDPVTLTFDLILFGGRGIVIDYLCVKVWRFLFQPFWFYHADKQTDRSSHTYIHTHAHTQTRGWSPYSYDYRRRE